MVFSFVFVHRDLESNRIDRIDDETFLSFTQLEDLYDYCILNLIKFFLQFYYDWIVIFKRLCFTNALPVTFFYRNVGKNVFERLPTKGLERLLHLKTFNNPNLRQFPPPEHFPRIQSLVLSYAYHCCSFLPLQPSDDDQPPPSQTNSLHESVIFPANENDFDMTLWNSSMSDIWPQLR